jgi:EAL domain-containing protein (putative c-di-GMP-specific phosphodiesterase class I)/CheY-like chemotaxis protein
MCPSSVSEGETMDEQQGIRPAPLICVTDGKAHIRKFLREMLSEYAFTVCECVGIAELSAALDAEPPNLVVLGMPADGIEAGEVLRLLGERNFEGRVLPVVPRSSAAVAAIQEIAEEARVALLPPLFMPFGRESLHESIKFLLPDASSGPLVDMGEAVRGGWLELWYQPKIDTQAITMRGAEALLRVRHPVWGIVPTAYFIADDGDPRSGDISDIVISRAVADWHHFFLERGPIELAVNLPITFLQNRESITGLARKLPDHTAFEGLIIESNGTDIVRNLAFAKTVARSLRDHKVAISIDDLGAEWLALTGLRDFPFVEVKVDRKFVTGCGTDRLKQSMCRTIVDLAHSYGARTVAEGVETWADFLAARAIGFDLVQGFLFAKPMSAVEFAQTCWAGTQTWITPQRGRSALFDWI